MVTKGEKGGWINQEVVINIYALLYIKQVTNKDLLYSIGNYTLYFVITIPEKNLKKNIYYIYITEYVCITESIAVHLKLTQQCKLTTLQ